MKGKDGVCFVDKEALKSYTVRKTGEGGAIVVIASAAIGAENGHIAGRQLLEKLYRETVGGPMPQILREEGGKPYFADSSWHFSISHTPKHVFCALSQKRIGIDAEELDRDIRLMLADKILSAGERTEYDRAEDKRLALLTFWVLKEAEAKYTGKGIRGYPNKTNFTLTDPRVQRMDGCLVAVIEGE